MAESTISGIEASPSSHRNPERSAISLTNEVVTGPDRRVNIRVARNNFLAGPESSTATVSRTASRIARAFLFVSAEHLGSYGGRFEGKPIAPAAKLWRVGAMP